jgi:uncharacterized protein (UPF0218 family)
MPKHYILPTHLRKEFARPIGELFTGSPEVAIPKVIYWLKQGYPSCFKDVNPLRCLKLICVGDVVSKAMIDNPILQPLLKICFVDDITQRGAEISWEHIPFHQITLENPKGAISEEAINFIRTVIHNTESHFVKVIGEEDLLVLPAVLEGDTTTIVFYGQPPLTDLDPPVPAGCVAIQVTPNIKERLRSLFAQFEVKENIL